MDLTMKASVIDVEALLQPIPGDNPVGDDLSFSALYDEIREARRSEDNLDRGDWKREPKKADWWKVCEITTTALSLKTKDLQVAAWLTESLAKLHGLPGLRDGCKLIRGLHERFWDGLYPEIDDGDLDARAQTLEWFDRQLAIILKDVPIAKSSGDLDFFYLHLEEYYEKVKTLNRIEEADERASTKAMLEQWNADWNKARGATPLAFYEQLYSLLNECWHELETLDRIMDERYGKQTSGVNAIRNILDSIRVLIGNAVRSKSGDEVKAGNNAESLQDGSQDAALAEATGEATGTFSAAIRTRQDAIRHLNAAAEYFLKTEPHSPVPYLVQRAIKWGQMPLADWLQDVIKNDGVLDQLRETLGLRRNSDEKTPE